MQCRGEIRKWLGNSSLAGAYFDDNLAVTRCYGSDDLLDRFR
jgi:hypothetical protein